MQPAALLQVDRVSGSREIRARIAIEGYPFSAFGPLTGSTRRVPRERRFAGQGRSNSEGTANLRRLVSQTGDLRPVGSNADPRRDRDASPTGLGPARAHNPAKPKPASREARGARTGRGWAERQSRRETVMFFRERCEAAVAGCALGLGASPLPQNSLCG